MRRGLAWFDVWVQQGPFTRVDVAAYRIIYAAVGLLTFPRVDFVSGYPDAFYDAPVGPFRLLSSPPPHAVLLLLEAVVLVALAALLVGLHTRTASVVTGLGFMLLMGFTFAYGKIDHVAFLWLTPIVMSFSNWGDALSFDATRSRRHERETSQWPLRLLAVCLGVAFLTAAVPKLLTGWLTPTTHAVQGHFMVRHVFEGYDRWLAAPFSDVQSGLLWDGMDVATLTLEFGLILLVLRWSWFRFGLAVATVFHVSVLLLLGIGFASNVLAYGAFVSWSKIVPHAATARVRTIGRAAQYAVAVAIAAAAFLLAFQISSDARFVLTSGIVFLGGAFGLVYLARVAQAGRTQLVRS